MINFEIKILLDQLGEYGVALEYGHQLRFGHGLQIRRYFPIWPINGGTNGLEEPRKRRLFIVVRIIVRCWLFWGIRHDLHKVKTQDCSR